MESTQRHDYICTGWFWVLLGEIGAGEYNRERGTTAIPQATTERDALWGMCIRAPLGNRFSHAGSASTCGCPKETNVADYVILSDCYPTPQEAYDTSPPNVKKFEAREKRPETLDTTIRCAKQHICIWRLFYGIGRKG